MRPDRAALFRSLPTLPTRDAVRQALAQMTEDELKEFDALLPDLRVNWAPLPGPQTAAFLSKADILLYGGAAGGGKGQALDAPVLTPFGWRPMGSLRIGSKVCTADGSFCDVIAVHPLGVQQLYRVTFADGTSCEVTDDHRWLAWRAGSSDKKMRIFTTHQMRSGEYVRRFLIPVADPVLFTDTARYERRPLDPYLLGLLLGDGSLSHLPSLSSADPEIFTAAAKITRIRGPYYYGGSKCGSVVLPDIKPLIVKLGLDYKDSYTKFIPKAYLLGSLEERWALLQGLMDTDGWANKHDLGFCSSSPQLAADVAALARSLGAFVSQRNCMGRYWKGGKPHTTVPCYVLRLKFRDPAQAFRLRRKKIKSQAPQGMYKAVISIEPTRLAEAQCISISSPFGLYLTNDYIVTHNSDLLLGLAGLCHHRSVIFRRVYPSLRAIIDRSRQIFNPGMSAADADRYNESLHRWRLGTTAFDPQIEFGSLQHEKDVQQHQGQARDFHGFDEVTEFTEQQVRFIIGWNRSTRPEQRCRVVLTSNPPTTKEGRWVVKFFAPWLDEKHPRPALPGELRWFTTIGGKDVEVDGPEEVTIDGEKVRPKSRTFIPALVQDNPYLVEAGYISTLQAMPEPLRSILLYGDWKAGTQDDPWQLIPTAWVKAAQKRWRDMGGKPPVGPHVRMDQLGVDVSRGGAARTVLSPRYGNFFAEQIVYPGVRMEDGDRVTQAVVTATPEYTTVVVDVIGVGSSAYDGVKRVRPAYAMNGAASSTATDKTGRLGFFNKRAEWHWKVREMLDPKNPEAVAVPDDPELFADLTAPTWELTRSGIKIEPKEDIMERLGRSTDKGDSFIYAAVPCTGGDLLQGSAVTDSTVRNEDRGSPWELAAASGGHGSPWGR